MRCRKIFAVFIGLFLGVLCIVPVGDWVLGLWEAQYPPIKMQDLPNEISGIIILGGADARLASVAKLREHYPDTQIIFTGNEQEAAQAKAFLEIQGELPDHIILDGKADNTFDNAVRAGQYVDNKTAPQLLVTSASHMMRAENVFIHQGWNIISYPVDYRARENSPFLCLCPIENLSKLNIVAHEIVGLIVYRFTGKI